MNSRASLELKAVGQLRLIGSYGRKLTVRDPSNLIDHLEDTFVVRVRVRKFSRPSSVDRTSIYPCCELQFPTNVLAWRSRGVDADTQRRE